MSQKKYLFIANSLFTIINFRSELIESILGVGDEVTVVCPKNDLFDLGEENNKLLSYPNLELRHVELSRSGLNPYSDLKYFFKLMRVIGEVRPDVVVCYTIKPVIYGSIASSFKGVHTIASNMTGLGYVFTDNGLKASLIRRVVKFQMFLALRCNDIIFFQNPDDYQLISETVGIPEKLRVSLINGSGVNLERFRPLSDVAKIKFSFIFVGRLIKEKGIFEFLQMAADIKSRHPKATFTILGAFDDHPSAVPRKLIEDYVDRGIVQYEGYVSNVSSVLSKHEVCILPSYREGTPRSVLEAMAIGMPVITTNAPGCRETVIDGLNGFLIPVRDVESLSIAVLKFIEDPALVNEMGKESLEIAQVKYDVHKVNKKFLDDISKLD